MSKPHNLPDILAGAVARQGLISRVSAAYMSYTTVCMRVRDAWRTRASDASADFVSSMFSPALLVLDDIDLKTEFESDLLGHVVNERYAAQKPILMVTSMASKEFAARLGERTVDRMREDCGEVVPFAWESHRGKSAKQ